MRTIQGSSAIYALLVSTSIVMAPTRAAAATSFRAPFLAFDAGITPLCVASGDLNGDGKPDLAVATYGENTVSVMLGLGSGNFAPRVTYPTGAGPYSVATADVNGDAGPDLVTANLHA